MLSAQVGIPSTWCDIQHWPEDERLQQLEIVATGRSAPAPATVAPLDTANAMLAVQERLAQMLDAEIAVASM